jgi:predicted component of type VI protein secretion system
MNKSSFKKLVLISQEELDALRQTAYEKKIQRESDIEIKGNIKSSRYAVERELDAVLNESNLTDREKWLKYTQIFDKFKKKLSEKSKLLETNIKKEKTLVEKYPGNEKIIEDLRWIDKRKILQFLLHLKSTDISWNEAGEVIIRGENLSGSYINDLLEDALEYSGEDPLGWKEFHTELHRSNFPLSLIGNEERKEYIKNLDVTPTESEERVRRDIAELIEDFSTSPRITKARRRNPKRHVRRLNESTKSAKKLIAKKWQKIKL